MNARIQNIKCHETNAIKMRIFIDVLCFFFSLERIWISNKFWRQFITVYGGSNRFRLSLIPSANNLIQFSLNVYRHTTTTKLTETQSSRWHKDELLVDAVRSICDELRLKSVENSFSCFSASHLAFKEENRKEMVNVSAFFLSFTIKFYKPSFELSQQWVVFQLPTSIYPINQNAVNATPRLPWIIYDPIKRMANVQIFMMTISLWLKSRNIRNISDVT